MTATSCTDQERWTQWPADFLKGGRFEFISGPNKGATGSILGSTGAGNGASDIGITFNFGKLANAPAAGDYAIVHVDVPGNAQAGWWLDPAKPDAGVFSTEFKDLPPGTAGKQALRIAAPAGGDRAAVKSFFDTTAKRSYVQMHGSYRISLKAKSLTRDASLQIDIKRNTDDHRAAYFSKAVPLTDVWKDYSFDFSVNEQGNAVGPVEVSLGVRGGRDPAGRCRADGERFFGQPDGVPR